MDDLDVLGSVPDSAVRPHEVLVVAPAAPPSWWRRLLPGSPSVVDTLDAAVAVARGELVWFVDARAQVDREAWARCLRRLEQDPAVVHATASVTTLDGEVRSLRGLLATDVAVDAPVFAVVRRQALLGADDDAMASWRRVVAVTQGRVVRTGPVKLEVAGVDGPLPTLEGLGAGATTIDPDARPTVGWIGFHGNQNIGDEAVLRAARQLLPDVDLLPGGQGTHGTVLGGGTLLNANRFYQRVADELDAPGLAHLVLGTGVVSPSVRGFTEELEPWRAFLGAGPVGLRGPDSVAHLRTWGWDGPAEVVGDPALALSRPPGVASTEGRVLLMPVAASAVGQVEAADERRQVELLATAVRRWRAHGRDVRVLLAHPGDEAVVAALAARGVELPAEPAWDDLDAGLATIASAELVVATRLHGIVLAAAFDVPFVGLAYRPKLVDFARSVDAGAWVRPIGAWDADALAAATSGAQRHAQQEVVHPAVDAHRTALRGHATRFAQAVARLGRG